jgi:hypothetical protein
MRGTRATVILFDCDDDLRYAHRTSRLAQFKVVEREAIHQAALR